MSGRARLRLATLVGGLALALALALAARAMRPRPPLPVLGRVPEFRLVDELGAPFTTTSMNDHVSVVDFIFTRCPSSCPRLTATMRDLQTRFQRDAADVKLVSFSVDPENDTPHVLSEYARNASADPARWTFVTGPVDDVTRAVVLGFKVSAAKIATGANDYDVVHGEWMVLVDGKGNVRGYYPTSTEEETRGLAEDAERLVGEKK
jgi:protein SCO1/2